MAHLKAIGDPRSANYLLESDLLSKLNGIAGGEDLFLKWLNQTESMRDIASHVIATAKAQNTAPVTGVKMFETKSLGLVLDYLSRGQRLLLSFRVSTENYGRIPLQESLTKFHLLDLVEGLKGF